jgi:cytochrome c
MRRHHVCAGLLLAVVASASAQQSQQPPAGPQTKQVQALVEKAAAHLEKKGKAAFEDFRKEGSEWKKGDMYLFVYDLKSNVLLNAAFPEREGTNVAGKADAKGKHYHDEFIKVAQTKGSGWVDYMFPKPGQKEPSQKWTYVKAVKIDNTPGLIASGFYPE